jgi:hypothetical protein
VPVFWAQEQVWRPSPSITLTSANLTHHTVALGKHLLDLQQRYTSPQNRLRQVSSREGSVSVGGKSPSVFVVNLIDKQKSQGDLGMCLVRCLTLLQQRLPSTTLSTIIYPWLSFSNTKSEGKRGRPHKYDVDNEVTAFPLTEGAADVLDEDYADRQEVTVQDHDLMLPPVQPGGSSEHTSDKTPLTLRHIWYDFHAKTGSSVLASSVESAGGDVGVGARYPWREVLQHLDGAVFEVAGGDPIGFYMNISSKAATVLGLEPTHHCGQQSTIIRTNCIDSLDRTNVIQV